MNWQPLSKTDTALFKAMAILLIAGHNFMHLFPAPREMEFAYNPEHAGMFVNLLHQDPLNFVQATLAYLGHYGVQIFIFLTAYGLTKKFIATPSQPYFIFLKSRLAKIYPAFFLAIGLWLLTGFYMHGLTGPAKLLYWSLISLPLKLTFLSGFVPGQELAPVGPWWYIPFVAQCYAVFHLLFRGSERYGIRFLLAVSIGGILFSRLLQDYSFNPFYNVIGHLPEMCLGIYMARRDSQGMRLPVTLFPLAVGIFILSNMDANAWYLAPVSMLLILLFLFRPASGILAVNRYLRTGLLFIGSISMQIFLINGFLREPLIGIAQAYDHWLVTNLLLAAFLAEVCALAYVLSKLESRLRARFRGQGN